LTVISNNVHQVIGNESLRPLHATLTGPCRVLPQEYLNLQCRQIDLVLPPSGSQQEELVYHLASEITSPQSTDLVALRAGRRWVPSFEKMRLEQQENQKLPLRQGGVYLITGGLGGIGQAVARFLARDYQAKLVLIGRSSLPERAQWKQTAVVQGQEPDRERNIQQLQELEALGAEVLLLQADVRDEQQMRAVIGQIQERFGGLHGVFHAAGVPGIGLTQFKTWEQARAVLGPKVDGTLLLEEVLADTAVELLVLFSSVTAWIGGGPGQIDYSAANAFLGAYAQSQNSRGRRVVAIDWGEWQWNAWESGLTGFDSELQSMLRENRQKVGITFEEGIAALKYVLATDLAQIIVSTQNFPTLIEKSKRLTASSVLRQKHARRAAQEKHARPELLVSYVPARNEIEQRIVALWETLLGIAPIGIHDNFFELGGNSLIGISLIARLRKMFRLEALAAYVLYEAPTVSKMASYIGDGKSDQEVKERLERGERRRESQKRSALKARR
jgi:NAD(P)-dependent dehydrogenase (short-subunit alcohol dehydrogenase family)